jgi:hydroxymethylbilane synthase
VIRTTGDRVIDRPLAEIGGKGLFTKEIDEALLAGRIALAVHSMKDLPTVLPAGIVIGAVLERADPRDVLISRDGGDLDTLPPGARMGTASLRRRAQLLNARPDLDVQPLRGNVGTRLAKLEAGEFAGTVLAAAGLDRLGLQPAHASPMAPEIMLPAVAQGAIAIACREEDAKVRSLLQLVDHGPTALCVAAERSMLAVLDGSCRTPIGALARLTGSSLRLDGLVASPDGAIVERAAALGLARDAERIGRDLGRELRARMGVTWSALA